MKKRLLAMLLVLMLVVSLLPVGVLAAGDGDTVDRLRLMNKEAWELAAIEKAGYSTDDVLWATIMSARFFSGGTYTNWEAVAGATPDCYSNEGYLATDAGTKIVPSSVDRIVVELEFAYYGEAGKIISATAVFHDEEFTLGYSEGLAGVRKYAEFTLKSGQSYDKDYSVTFYFQPIGSTQWELYDIVYVNAGETLGSNMPADPNYGTQDFVNWQTQTDGGGDTLTSTTRINKNWVVYGTKTTAGGATAYHVMRDSTSYRYNALQDEVADAYNAKNGTSYTSGNVRISNIQVNGKDGEHTNPIYHSNGWNDDASHYYIYNVDAYAAESQPQNRNTRIPVSEVTGITLTGIIDEKSFSVTIPEDELALQEISNPVTSDTIIEISVCDKLDRITKELVDSAEDAPAGVNGVSYPVDGKVTIPEDGSVTLLYKITVTGDQNAEYIVTDEGATAVSGSLRGKLDAYGIAEIYVTKTFSAADVDDGVLTNSASLSNDNTTLPPDDGNDKDEVEVEVEDEGGEEPGPGPDDPEDPRDPTDTELGKLAVVLECTNGEVEHDEKTKAFHLRTTNSKCEIQQVGEGYICSVTPDYDKILSTYNTATKATHEYEDGGKQFVLTWNASTDAWENTGAPSITRQVKCETTEPEQPDVYKIDVTVHNGTATFCGSKVTSHILAAENEDITITFTPDEGYTLDYAKIDGKMLLIPPDGVYTLKQVDSNHTIEVVYAEDKLGDGEDGNEPDGTPDYRQVFVKYVAGDGNGVVNPSFDTFNLEVDENGKVMTNVALSLNGKATPNDKATFAYWTIEGLGYDGGAYSYEADLSGKGFTGYVAGQTYTFTAYFNVKPEQPDVYEIDVTVHNGTATFCGSEVTSHILAAENEDITITFTPDEGYTLDYATIDGNMLLIPDGGVYTLKQVNSDHTIEVVYAEDKLGDGEDGNEPDGTPDYRQVFVKYVAGDKNGFVTPSHDTFDLDVDENGKVMTDVALALSGTATANTDASFGYWTIEGSGYDGGTYSFEADLENENFSGYLPGETYTFTAYFNGPVVKPELKPYHINVEVVNGTAEFKETNIGANSVINVYPIKDDNKNVEITFVPTDGYVFDAAYVDDESITLSEDNSYTFTEVTADVTIKVLFKQDSVPITPVTPLPTPGEISDLIKDSITVDCVNGEVAHADKVYGLLDGSLVNVEKTGDTSIKVTLDATVYQARYNTDTETKHSLADGQSATVTFALNYVDQKWRVAEGELPITIKVVCETPVEPEPAITGFSKTLVKDRNLYVYQGLAYPTFYRGSVIVDEGDGVTLLYKITVKGTPGTEFTVRDDSADFAQTGEIPDSGETSFYVAKTFTWREIRRADELTNTAAVLLDGKIADSDTETIDVDIDWDYNPPVVDDDDEDDVAEPDDEYIPNWLNTEDHYSYIVGYEDGTIKPNNNITRAEVATIFYRLLTDSSRERWYTDSNSFTDVADDSWYNEPVSTLSRMGIINGYEDGSFKPNAPITRAEFTAIATRFFDYSARYDGAFYDVSAGSWYADYIQAAVDMGLVEGYPDGGVHPGSNITRAEAVTIVNRVLNRVPHEDHLLSTRVMNTWPDNKPGAWYYADMQEATNSHDYDWTRVDGKLVEDWTNKLADPNW